MNILVIDDDQTILETVSDYLTHKGYNIFTAENGVEGLQYIHRADLVFVDYHMPRMDGLTFTHQARKLDFSKPIYYMTAFAVKNGIHRAVERGEAQGIISKPFDLSDLDEAIEQGGAEVFMLSEIRSSIRKLEQKIEEHESNQVKEFKSFREENTRNLNLIKEGISKHNRIIYGDDEGVEGEGLRFEVQQNSSFRENAATVIQQMEIQHETTKELFKWVRNGGILVSFLLAVIALAQVFGDIFSKLH